MGTLEIRLLGTFSLACNGQPLAPLSGQRVRDLLSYIVLNRHTAHSRERLAGLFWSDRDTYRARHCLNTALWRLQRLLASSGTGVPCLAVTGQTIGFNALSNVSLDVLEFERRCSWAEQAADELQRSRLYHDAIALYHGDLLTDCYEDWCLIERQRLQQLYLRALSRLFAFHERRAEHDAAIAIARRLLESDPLREEVHRDLMRVYLAAGQPAAALRQYALCESLLARELGIQPMPETQALLRNLRAALDDTSVSPAAALDNALEQLNRAVSALHSASKDVQRAARLVEDAIGRGTR